ncbi:hypothetical protein E8E11_010461 [Didymella keratinophila]|nr:hypothetical protein E8E11_010461 [Didymella keratinophila]
MAAWYWFVAKFNADVCDTGTYSGFGTMSQALRVNPRSNRAGTGLQCFQIRHENENAKFPDGTSRPPLEYSYTVGGKLYHPTKAEHFLAIDVRNGGSPIGATIGFLLMRHKKELGNKYVTGVRVLRNDGIPGDTRAEVDLVFHIGDVPPEKQREDEPMGVDSPKGGAGVNARAFVSLAPRDAAVADEQ